MVGREGSTENQTVQGPGATARSVAFILSWGGVGKDHRRLLSLRRKPKPPEGVKFTTGVQAAIATLKS